MIDALLEQYVVESRECLEDAGTALLALEKTPDAADLIDRLFRALHTLKGGAGLFALNPIVRVTHAAEDILDAIRNGRSKLPPSLADIFFAVLDQTGAWIDTIETDGVLPPDAPEISTALLARLQPYRVDAAPAVVVDAVDISWVSRLPEAAWLEPSMLSSPNFTAVIYTPDEGCFFGGDDPLHIMRNLPGICALHVEANPPLPPLATLNIYNCQLRFFALSVALRSEIESYCAGLKEQVAITGLTQAHLQPALPDASVESRMFEQVVRAQLQILDLADFAGASYTRFQSCQQTIRNTLRYMKMHDALTQFETVCDTAVSKKDVEIVRQFLRSLVSGDIKEEVAEKTSTPVTATVRASTFVKVEQVKIDQLLDLIGEMAAAKNGLLYLAQQSAESSREFSLQLKERYALIDRVTQGMQDIAVRIRMTPLSMVFQRLPRLVRNLANQLERKIDFVIEGEDAEADKNIIELLAEPLLHMLRNSLVHGIEPAAQRQASGKNATATIRIRAFQRSDSIVIDVYDDGRGIDPAAVKRKAVESLLLEQGEADALDTNAALNLVFLPGFSTTQQISDLSGRGVGMDVVKSTIERTGGSVFIASEIGVGTTITITLPLLVAASKVMTIRVADQLFGIPMAQVRQTLRLPRTAIRKIRKKETFVLRDEVIPLLHLRTLLSLSVAEVQQNDDLAILLVRSHQGTLGLTVDDFSEPADVVMKPMDGILRGLNNYAGSALLADGSVLLVLDLEEVIHAG